MEAPSSFFLSFRRVAFTSPHSDLAPLCLPPSLPPRSWQTRRQRPSRHSRARERRSLPSFLPSSILPRTDDGRDFFVALFSSLPESQLRSVAHRCVCGSLPLHCWVGVAWGGHGLWCFFLGLAKISQGRAREEGTFHGQSGNNPSVLELNSLNISTNLFSNVLSLSTRRQ